MTASQRPDPARFRWDDDSFHSLYGRFAARTPADVAAFFDGYPGRWHITGGWAIEALTGVVRPHEDIDPVIETRDLEAFAAHCGDRYHLWTATGGTLRPYLPELAGFGLPEDCHQLWLRLDASQPWEYDVLLAPSSDADVWVCRRDESITLPWDRAVRHVDTIPYLALAPAMLMKAKRAAAKDTADLTAALPRLSTEERTWLADSLAHVHPDHAWLEHLA